MTARGGVIKVLLGAGLFLLWWRGYLSALLAQAGTALTTPGGPPKVPFGAPGQGIPSLNPLGK